MEDVKKLRLRRKMEKAAFKGQPKMKLIIKPRRDLKWNPTTRTMMKRKSPTIRGYTFRIDTPSKAGQYVPKLTGDLFYRPYKKTLEVGIIEPTKASFNLVEAHSKYANKMLKPKETRTLLGKIAKVFPKAEVIEGERVTGTRLRGPGMQRFNLKTVRKLMERTLQKAGKKGTLKTAAKIAGKTGGKLIPGLGAVLLAKDAYDVGKWAYKKYKET